MSRRSKKSSRTRSADLFKKLRRLQKHNAAPLVDLGIGVGIGALTSPLVGLIFVVMGFGWYWWEFVSPRSQWWRNKQLLTGWAVILLLSGVFYVLRIYPSSPDPRRLRPEQRTFLIERLQERRTSRLITIIALKDTNKEAGRYGEDFVELFKAAGWNVKKQPYDRLKAAPVMVWHQFDDPVAAFLLVQLQGAGVEVEPRSAGYSDEIKFIVGPQQ